MRIKSCVIAGAGPLFGHRPATGSDCLVIAADGGYRHLAGLGISPDVIIGDFDSLPEPPEGGKVIALAREKDDTDMLAAIRYGLEKGCRTFHLYGGTGGRFDHTAANLQCLAYLAGRDARGFLYGEGFTATCIRNGEIRLGAGRRGTVSVLAHSDTASGVCIEGLKYRLCDACLSNAYPLGVSNEFIGSEGRISVREGTVMVILPEDATNLDDNI